MALKNKRFADDGWAVWVNGDDNSTVYINDWLTPTGDSYVDFAVRIRGVKSSALLNVYVPFGVTKDEIIDTSLKFEDEGVLRATFSAACVIDYKKNECTSEIAYNARTIDLVHISCLEYELKPLSSGTLITVNIEKLQEYLANDEAYFLWRMPHKSLNEIFKPHINVGGLLTRLRDLITTPVVSEKYGYSIRINEARLLPDEINRIGAFHRQKLKKAVITISIGEDYSMNDANCYRIRRVEKELYKDYAPECFNCDDAITYQWNQNRNTDMLGHFNFYFDVSRDYVSKMSMFIYMILLMVVGIIGGFLEDLIKLIFRINW
ncbi:MAG: hypothetical protein PUB42_01135 [Firmicutes bacterium]|nr:hypothetical protein [Bacillota bacterium]